MRNQYSFGLRGKSTLILGSLLFLLLLISNFTSYWQSRTIAEAKIIELEKSKLSLFSLQIEGALENHHNNLLTLIDVPPVTAIIRARANNGIDPENGNTLQQWRQRLTVIFKAFLKTHPEYQQIRYLDTKGNELIRVQIDIDGKLRAIEEKYLQNKSKEEYVIATLKLKPGEAYYSDVSLNREHGVIQVPHLPVLRMASPFHLDNKLSGLIVMNISTEKLFSGIHSSATNGSSTSIVNHNGYYLKHDTPNKTFGWELGIDYRFQNIEPELASYAISKDQFFRRHAEHDNEMDGFKKIYFDPTDASRYWLLTLNIPEHVVFSETNSALNTSMLISLFFGLLALIVIVYYVSKNILTPIIHLATAADKLQHGDLSIRVDHSQVKDEFFTLYTAINAFAENQQDATSSLEEEVSTQTKRLSAVIDNIIDGIITIDDNGAIESVNPAARNIFGYTDEEVIGQNVKMLMPEPYHHEHDTYLNNYITTGKKKIIGIGNEVVGRRRDGSTFPLELAVSEVLIDGNRHFVGITRDITDRKRNEQLQKEFVSTVSHELRTPLTSISGTLGLLAGNALGEIPEQAKSLIDVAYKNSTMLASLINDLLDMDKLVAGKMEFTLKLQSIMPLIKQSLEANQAYGDKYHVTFNLISTADVQVECDAGRLTQVLNNFLSNAAKFSPSGGHVDIAVIVKDHCLRVEVIDQGEGIPEKFKNRIFKKFSQADSSDTRLKGGTGLGLSISKELIERMNGKIGFDSEEGKGTCFYFEFSL